VLTGSETVVASEAAVRRVGALLMRGTCVQAASTARITKEKRRFIDVTRKGVLHGIVGQME
jgi:hypothetical protein